MNSKNQDSEHLRLLSIFHFVMAGIVTVFSMLPVIHVLMGFAMVLGAFDDIDNGAGPPAAFGWLLIIIPLLIMTVGLIFAGCLAMTGRRLRQHSHYTFCFVVAALECAMTPLGTVLGIFTIIVLLRPTVKELFGVADPTQSDSSVAL